MDSWSRQSDGELIRHIQHGAGEGLAEFYSRFAPALRGYFARRVADEGAIDDLLQETMVAAINAIMRFRGDSQVFTWLCGIARHKLLDHYGACRLKPSSLENEAPASGAGDAVDLLCESELVQGALARLPQEYRRAMELRYIEEMPVAEVARSMNRTLKSIESILVRARKLFAREYQAMLREVESIG